MNKKCVVKIWDSYWLFEWAERDTWSVFSWFLKPNLKLTRANAGNVLSFDFIKIGSRVLFPFLDKNLCKVCVQLAFVISVFQKFQHAWSQSHCREVPRWAVFNGARHNWKCFLTNKKIRVCFFKFHIFLIDQNVPKIIETFLGCIMVS